MTWQHDLMHANWWRRFWKRAFWLLLGLVWLRSCGDQADAFVATDAVQDLKGWLAVAVLVVVVVALWRTKPPRMG